MLEQANTLGPIIGVFHLAAVLHDATIENQTKENFLRTFQPKATAAKLLDEFTRTLCPNLRNFVVFSSVSCGRGITGQTYYGMANSAMERVCEKRKNDGLPALAIQWGAIGEVRTMTLFGSSLLNLYAIKVGMVAEMKRGENAIKIGGTLPQGISSCLEVMDQLMGGDDPVVSSTVIAQRFSASGSAENAVDCLANIIGKFTSTTIKIRLSTVKQDCFLLVTSHQDQVLLQNSILITYTYIVDIHILFFCSSTYQVLKTAEP